MTEPTIYEISSPGRTGVTFPVPDVPLAKLPENLLRKELPLPELAEEFGITTATLSAYMQHHGGPKAVLKHGGNYSRSAVTYYDPDEVRKWWKELKEK